MVLSCIRAPQTRAFAFGTVGERLWDWSEFFRCCHRQSKSDVAQTFWSGGRFFIFLVSEFMFCSLGFGGFVLHVHHFPSISIVQADDSSLSLQNLPPPTGPGVWQAPEEAKWPHSHREQHAGDIERFCNRQGVDLGRSVSVEKEWFIKVY